MPQELHFVVSFSVEPSISSLVTLETECNLLVMCFISHSYHFVNCMNLNAPLGTLLHHHRLQPCHMHCFFLDHLEELQLIAWFGALGTRIINKDFPEKQRCLLYTNSSASSIYCFYSTGFSKGWTAGMLVVPQSGFHFLLFFISVILCDTSDSILPHAYFCKQVCTFTQWTVLAMVYSYLLILYGVLITHVNKWIEVISGWNLADRRIRHSIFRSCGKAHDLPCNIWKQYF